MTLIVLTNLTYDKYISLSDGLLPVVILCKNVVQKVCKVWEIEEWEKGAVVM